MIITLSNLCSKPNLINKRDKKTNHPQNLSFITIIYFIIATADAAIVVALDSEKMDCTTAKLKRNRIEAINLPLTMRYN